LLTLYGVAKRFVVSKNSSPLQARFIARNDLPQRLNRRITTTTSTGQTVPSQVLDIVMQ
jgi:hypothetical protein